MEKVRILMVIGKLEYCNGVTAYCMNYYRKIDHRRFAIDFAIHQELDAEDFAKDYYDEILGHGDRVFSFGDYGMKSMASLKKRAEALFDERHYDIVHVHVLNVAYFYLKPAKKKGIPVRIVHSHATKNSDNRIKRIRNHFLKEMGLRYCTNRIACSRLAGDYLFGQREYAVINNAIEYRKYSFDPESRIKVREKSGISDRTLFIGFVGRFAKQKNIRFILDILNRLNRDEFDFKAVLIGNGPLKEEIERFIVQHHLNDRIVLMESCPDVHRYYSAMDVMVMPSFFEGLPVTGVEAQYADLKCLFSDKITREVDFGKSVFLPIVNAEVWVEEIKKIAPYPRFEVVNDSFDIDSQVSVLEDYYAGSLNKGVEK